MEENKDLKVYDYVILHIPHSSVKWPKEFVSEEHSVLLTKEQYRLIDLYTNSLFASELDRTGNIEPKIFPYCRFFCDVERLINDPLESKGLGITSHESYQLSDGSIFKIAENNFSTYTYYQEFHQKMENHLLDLYLQYPTPNILIIDCHSFSSLPTELVPTPSDIDICIGFNDDHTKPSDIVIEGIKKYFEDLGYKVGLNTPFSNSKTFNTIAKYNTIMIEINKRLYMNELTLKINKNFEKLRDELNQCYKMIMNYKEAAHSAVRQFAPARWYEDNPPYIRSLYRFPRRYSDLKHIDDSYEEDDYEA